MQKTYFHNEVLSHPKDDLQYFCKILSGKAIVVNPRDSKIIKILHAGDTVGIENVISQKPIENVAISQGKSIVLREEFVVYLEEIQNAPAQTRRLIEKILDE